MKITWYGTASIVLESEGFRLAVDPFLGIPLRDSSLRRQLAAVPLRNVDAVLVTHGHFDHILDIPRLYKNSEIEIYATAAPCHTLLTRGFPMGRLRRIKPGDVLTLGGFTVNVFQGRHCVFDMGVALKTIFKADTFLNIKRLLQLWRLNKFYEEKGETLFYEIEAEGKRVQLMGSMGMDPVVEYPTGADALILPFQGTGSPARTVTPIIGALKPGAVYLDHYDDAFPPLSSQVRTVDFAAKMCKKGIPAAAMLPGKTYMI